jgi:hypothetical protein
MSSVLAMIQKDVLGLNRAVNLTTGSFNRMKLATIGLGAVTIGGVMLAGVYELSKAGEKYVHQIEQMKIAGMSLAEQQIAINAANRTSNSVMTASPTHNLETIRELRMALMSADKDIGKDADPARATQMAVQHLEKFQQAAAVMTSVLGKDAGSQVYEMAKALEMIGASQDPARFDKLLDGMVRSSIASGGKLTGSDFFSTFKYLRSGGQYLDDDFLMYVLPALMQEMKTGSGSGSGGGAGNPLASAFQAIVGNVFGDKAAKVGVKLGLIDPTKLHLTTTGKLKSADVGAWRGSDEFAHNPFKYVQHELIPALTKAHLLDKDKNGKLLNIGKLAATLANLFGNRTAQQIMTLMVNQQGRIIGDAALTKSAQHVDQAYDEASRHDPMLVREEFGTQLGRIATDLGKSITPALTTAIYDLASGLAYFATVIERHPVIAKWVIGFIAAMGGFLVVVGTIAIAVAAIAALGTVGIGAAVVVGITAVGAALVWLYSKVNWADAAAWARGAVHSIGGWVSGIAYAVGGWAARLWGAARQFGKDALGWVEQIITSLKTDLISIWTGLTEGLLDFVNKLGAWVASIPGRLAGALGALTTPPPGTPSGWAAQPTPTAYHGLSGRGGHTVIENVIYLDGEVAYRANNRRQARDANRPMAGRGDVDPRMNLLYAT